MIRVLQIVLLALIFNVSYSQKNCDCFERLSSLADYYQAIGEKDSAVIAYTKAVKYLKDYSIHLSSTVLYYLSVYYANVNFDSSLYYLDLALIKGSKKSYLKYEEAFDSLKQTDEWTTILEKELY